MAAALFTRSLIGNRLIRSSVALYQKPQIFSSFFNVSVCLTRNFIFLLGFRYGFAPFSGNRFVGFDWFFLFASFDCCLVTLIGFSRQGFGFFGLFYVNYDLIVFASITFRSLCCNPHIFTFFFNDIPPPAIYAGILFWIVSIRRKCLMGIDHFSLIFYLLVLTVSCSCNWFYDVNFLFWWFARLKYYSTVEWMSWFEK